MVRPSALSNLLAVSAVSVFSTCLAACAGAASCLRLAVRSAASSRAPPPGMADTSASWVAFSSSPAAARARSCPPMAAWVLSAPSAASRARNRSSRSALTVPPSCATLGAAGVATVSTVPEGEARPSGAAPAISFSIAAAGALTPPLSCGIVISEDASEPPVSPPLADSPVLTVSGASFFM